MLDDKPKQEDPVPRDYTDEPEDAGSFDDGFDRRGDVGGFFIPPNTAYPSFE